MEKIMYLLIKTPFVFVISIVVFLTYISTDGLNFTTGSKILFWWFVACSVIIGAYISLLNFWAIAMSSFNNFDCGNVKPGWNLKNRPSLIDLEKEDSESAFRLGEMHDTIDNMESENDKDDSRKVLIALLILSTFPLGVYLLTYSSTWMILCGISVLLFGFVTYIFQITKKMFI